MRSRASNRYTITGSLHTEAEKMKTYRSRRWMIYMPAICLILFVLAEKFNLLKTDSLVAAACTKELFLAKPHESAILAQYKNVIATEAQQYDLPSELLAAIIYSHQTTLTPFRKFTDCAGSALGYDFSLGLAQIRISNAVTNDRLHFASMAPGTFKNYRSVLLDPAQNIKYQAKELRLLLERGSRFPGITSEEVIHAPFIMALLMSEYRMGRQEAESIASKLSANAFWDLRLMQGNSVYIFDRNMADSVQIQNNIREYLDYIYCKSSIFNSSTCDDWHNEVLETAANFDYQ
jgi:hypothetical protein